jgi:hypothetical protein
MYVYITLYSVQRGYCMYRQSACQINRLSGSQSVNRIYTVGEVSPNLSACRWYKPLSSSTESLMPFLINGNSPDGRTEGCPPAQARSRLSQSDTKPLGLWHPHAAMHAARISRYVVGVSEATRAALTLVLLRCLHHTPSSNRSLLCLFSRVKRSRLLCPRGKPRVLACLKPCPPLRYSLQGMT